MNQNTAPLMPHDLNFLVNRLPRDVRNLLHTHSGQLFVAGGFIRATLANERVNDIDILGSPADFMQSVAKDFTLERGGRLYTTDNAYTVLSPPRLPVQFIHRWTFNDPHALIHSFDFTIAQAAIWHENNKWQGLCSERFYPDLAARRLYYTAPERKEAVGGSFLRMRKFLRQGYNIQAFSMGRLVARLIKGIHTDSFSPANEDHNTTLLVGLLREVDPLTVVDGVELVDEHATIQEEQELSDDDLLT